MDVGFIGLGNMGNPMARNLIRAGHQLVVYDLREDAAANLIELGARWAASPRAVAEQCRVAFTSLPGPPEVERVLLGPDGVLAGAARGSVVFDLSSNAPAVIRRIAAQAADQGVIVLDSPVSGGVSGAEKGTLAVMVGGERAAFDEYRELLGAIGANVFHLGPVGNGSVVKLMNNLIALSIGPLLDEAVVVGAKAGIPPATLFEVMSVSSAGPLVRGLPRLFRRTFEDASFALALARKDVGLAVGAGRDLGVPMPVAAAVEQVYEWAKGNGLGDKNSLATLLLYERAAGVEIHADDVPPA
ncbi:MAG TPA: NAD(P)-binding domain-containing protein [Dehalococcoidia bacterium]|nr:NAD(P)-binding domain-containing protein [Dehalococcoidia bacterium]